MGFLLYINYSYSPYGVDVIPHPLKWWPAAIGTLFFLSLIESCAITVYTSRPPLSCNFLFTRYSDAYYI